MRAVGVIEFGGPEALAVVDVPETHAGEGEIRLRVHAAAVNPTDTYTRNGARAAQLAADPPPYVPGMDAAGVVDEIGPGAATQKPLTTVSGTIHAGLGLTLVLFLIAFFVNT